MIFKRMRSWQSPSNNKLLSCLIGLPLLFNSLPGWAAEVSISRLIINPISCVLEKKNTPCTKQVTFYWMLKKAESFCIYIDNASQPVSCHEQQQGQVTIEHPVYKNTKVELRSKQSTKVLAWAQILVSPLNMPKRRPKNRHAWSIF
ncbi:DUF3019 domain-containing protein [Thalassotalea sp. ND16A]|uniref:DUF3019 domain-containing protein n=1 Tax=Thalassotalea sp. ND16A TaxID=1535422 RepID=UPI00051A0A0F|nr:DUF3019 domain-containing protein [Thalassotalea sp. ND16A]